MSRPEKASLQTVIDSIYHYYLKHHAELQNTKQLEAEIDVAHLVNPDGSRLGPSAVAKDVKDFLKTYIFDSSEPVSVHDFDAQDLDCIFHSRKPAHCYLIRKAIREFPEAKDDSFLILIAEKLAFGVRFICDRPKCRKPCSLIIGMLRLLTHDRPPEFLWGFQWRSIGIDFISKWAANCAIKKKQTPNLHQIPDIELNIDTGGISGSVRRLNLNDFLKTWNQQKQITVNGQDTLAFGIEVAKKGALVAEIAHQTMRQIQEMVAKDRITHISLEVRLAVARLLDLDSIIKMAAKEEQKEDVRSRWLSALSLIAPQSFLHKPIHLPEVNAAHCLAQLLSKEHSPEVTLLAFRELVKQERSSDFGHTFAIVALHEQWFLSDRSNRKIPILEIVKDPYNGLAKQHHLPLYAFVQTMAASRARSSLVQILKHFFTVTDDEAKAYKYTLKHWARRLNPYRDTDLLTAEIQELISKVVKSSPINQGNFTKQPNKQGNPTSELPCPSDIA